MDFKNQVLVLALTLAHRATKSHLLSPATPVPYFATETKLLSDHLPHSRAESESLKASLLGSGCCPGVHVAGGSSGHPPASPEWGRGEALAAGPWCEDGSVIYPANKASGSFYSLPGAPQAHVSTCLEARDKEQNKGQEATTLPFLEAACAAHRDVGTSRDGHPSFGHLSTPSKKTLKDCLIGCSATPNI